MAFLKVKNRAFSPLASGVDDAVTEWTVATGEGSKFPTTGDFHVTCEDEIVKCTSRSTDVLTVVRAQEGTSGAAHVSGKAVELRITAAIMEALQIQLLDDDGDTGIEVEQSADEDKVHIKTAGNECGLFSDAGILTLAKQAGCFVANDEGWQGVDSGTHRRICFMTENSDIQNEFNSILITGTAEDIVGANLKDTGVFTEAEGYYLDMIAFNDTDTTYTTVTGKTDDNTLTLAADIFDVGETYYLFHSKFTAKEDGDYLIIANTRGTINDQDGIAIAINKNGDVNHIIDNSIYAAKTANTSVLVMGKAALVANDYITISVYQNSGGNVALGGGAGNTVLFIIKLT